MKILVVASFKLVKLELLVKLLILDVFPSPP